MQKVSRDKIIGDLIFYAYEFAVYLDRELLKSAERCIQTCFKHTCFMTLWKCEGRIRDIHYLGYYRL